MNTSAELASTFLNSEVRYDGTQYVGICKVSFWMPLLEFPPLRVAVCEGKSSHYVISKDMASVEKFLMECQPPIDQLPVMTELLSKILPIGWRVLSEQTPSCIRSKTGDRPGPFFDGDTYVFFCNDFRRGRVIRCEINSLFQVACEDVGQGDQFEIL